LGRDQGFKKSSDTGMLSGLGYLEPKYNKILRLLKNKKNIYISITGALILATILYILV